MMKKLCFILFVGSIFLFTLEARTPRLNTSFQFGDVESLWIDAFLPPYVTDDTAVFFDFQQQLNRFTSGSKLAYITSPGIGMRKKYGSKVFGGYLFADYNHSTRGKKYWGLGPGFDFFQGPFSVAVNGYIPIGKQRHSYRTQRELQSTTISTQAQGNQALQTTTDNYQTKTDYEKLPYGADVTGYYMAENGHFSGELGCYYYNAKHLKPITGVKAGVGYLLRPNLKLMVNNRYDNRSGNRVVAGIELSLGGIFNGDIKSKLTYPIYRNFNVNTTTKGTSAKRYTKRRIKPVETPQQFNNVYFVANQNFSPFGAPLALAAIPPNGSFENPFTSLDQALNGADGATIAPTNANLWIMGQSGQLYSTLASATAQIIGTQTVSGRTLNFQAPASKQSEMPIVQTYFRMTSDNDLQDLALIGNLPSGNTIGVHIEQDLSGSGKTAQLNNLLVGSSLPSQSFQMGIVVDSGGKASISNSNIQGLSTLGGGTSANAIGVAVRAIPGIAPTAIATATITNCTISTSSDTTNARTIRLDGGLANIDRTSLYSRNDGNFATCLDTRVGSAGNNAVVSFSNGTMVASNRAATCRAVQLSNADATLSNSTITSLNEDGAVGSFLFNSSTLDANNCKFYGTSTNGSARGLQVNAGCRANSSNSFFQGVSENSSADGAIILGVFSVNNCQLYGISSTSNGHGLFGQSDNPSVVAINSHFEGRTTSGFGEGCEFSSGLLGTLQCSGCVFIGQSETNAIGFNLFQNTQAMISNSRISAIGATDGSTGFADGIASQNTSVLNISNSYVNTTVIGDGCFGAQCRDDSVITIDSCEFTTSLNPSGAFGAKGLWVTVPTGVISVQNSFIKTSGPDGNTVSQEGNVINVGGNTFDTNGVITH